MDAGLVCSHCNTHMTLIFSKLSSFAFQRFSSIQTQVYKTVTAAVLINSWLKRGTHAIGSFTI